jgi:hypothetical protein
LQVNSVMALLTAMGQQRETAIYRKNTGRNGRGPFYGQII